MHFITMLQYYIYIYILYYIYLANVWEYKNTRSELQGVGSLINRICLFFPPRFTLKRASLMRPLSRALLLLISYEGEFTAYQISWCSLRSFSLIVHHLLSHRKDHLFLGKKYNQVLYALLYV